VVDLRRESVQAGRVHQYTVNPKQFIFLFNTTNIQYKQVLFHVSLMDPDPVSNPDPSISSLTFKMPMKTNLKNFFPVYYFFKVLIHHFQR
jgi:hypothetical protein